MKRPGMILFLAVLIAAALAIAAYEHGFAHFLGIDTQQSQNYDFVSGVGPMIVTSLGFTGAMAGVLHHVNCHVSGCWRIARYPLAGGAYKVCRVHLPEEHPARGRLTAARIHLAHRAHLGRHHEDSGA